MNRNLQSVMATGAVSAAALLAVAVIATTPAFADDITDRDTVAAFCAEASGSMYIGAQGAPGPARAMGAPAR